MDVLHGELNSGLVFCVYKVNTLQIVTSPLSLLMGRLRASRMETGTQDMRTMRQQLSLQLPFVSNPLRKCRGINHGLSLGELGI